jgi:hypothetical protein
MTEKCEKNKKMEKRQESVKPQKIRNSRRKNDRNLYMTKMCVLYRVTFND